MFYYYNALKHVLVEDKHEPSTSEKFLVGGLAGFFAMFTVYPLYVMQNRMAMAEQGRFKSIPDFFMQTYKMDGLKAFGSGFAVSAIRIFPYKGIDMLGYFTLKETFVPKGQNPTIMQSLLFGGVTSIFSQFLTFPLLTIRTKLMAQAPSLGRPIIYKGMIDCFQQTVAKDGWAGLYRGHTAVQMKMVPAAAISFATYEWASKALASYF